MKKKKEKKKKKDGEINMWKMGGEVAVQVRGCVRERKKENNVSRRERRGERNYYLQLLKEFANSS